MPPEATAARPERRILRFSTVPQVIEEVDRLVAAERAGALRLCGAWSLGQILNHLASWVGYAYTGTPVKLPWVVRFVLKFRKNAFLHSPMRAGLRIPGTRGGSLAIEPAPLDQALPAFRTAFGKLQRTPPTRPHVFLGPLTHDEWIALHLRHCELHLGFAAVAGDQPPR